MEYQIQQIDWPATRAKFDQLPKTHTQKKVAFSIGVGRAHFCQIMNGTYPFPNSARSLAVIAKLKELGVIVYKTGSESDLRSAGGAQ